MDKNIDLLTRLQEGENTEDQLVKQNMGLVMTIAKRFSYSGVEFEDLIQIGTIGLLKSIRNFETRIAIFHVRRSRYNGRDQKVYPRQRPHKGQPRY